MLVKGYKFSVADEEVLRIMYSMVTALNSTIIYMKVAKKINFK